MDSSADAPRTRNRHFAGPIVLSLLVGSIVFAAIIFLSVGRWLVVEDPLDKADAIVILSGRIPVRAKEAARLYNAGYAPQVWLTDEIRVIAAELERQKGAAVIIVTTKAHTRRVRTLWKKLSGGRGRAIVRAASSDPFEPGHWWRATSDALDVVREVLGLLNAWAGLPLHPSR